MRLESLYISGFKTFVEPVTISFKGDMVGVVGPNGCGKSNLFEAVSWVMGEVSARQLRGESMADVIFAGSGSRKPVSMASVELTFDNSSGRIGGRFGSYEKIQVKRTVDREGVSSYFLNGTRCRRRDIMEMFMGTGLGSRSYSMIEQGMISRLIEAKPEVLGAHLEEAARVSAYRQSRKETESRMRATRENLSRLRLTIDEVERQITTVRQQAAEAKKYRKLDQDEKRLQAELTALLWRKQEQEWRENEMEIKELMVGLEQLRAERSAAHAFLEGVRQEVSSMEEKAGQIQEQVYQSTSEVSQLEQKLQYGRDRINKLTAEIGQSEQRVSQQKEQQGEIEKDLQEAQAEEESRQKQALECEQDEQETIAALTEAERREQEGREQNERKQLANTELQQQLLVLDERCDSLRQRLQKIKEQQQRLEADLENLNGKEGDGLDDQRRLLSEQTKRVDDLVRQEQEGQEQLNNWRQQGEQLGRQAEEQHEQRRQIDSRLASLQEAQKVALLADKKNADAWLEQTGLSTAPRLADRLRVPAQWRTAVEIVLNIRLRDLELADTEQLLRFNSDNPSDVEVGAYATAIQPHTDNDQPPKGLSRLSDVVSEPTLPASYLDGVYVAEDLPQALAVRSSLGDGQSVITVEGVWFRT